MSEERKVITIHINRKDWLRIYRPIIERAEILYCSLSYAETRKANKKRAEYIR